MVSRLRDWLARLLAPLGPGDFEIRHRPGHPIAVRGPLPRSKIAGIAEFFARDLDADVTVRGKSRGRALQLRISGAIGPADRQRVRNFLTAYLR